MRNNVIGQDLSLPPKSLFSIDYVPSGQGVCSVWCKNLDPWKRRGIVDCGAGEPEGQLRPVIFLYPVIILDNRAA
jgi:hypothetical protein